MSELPSIDLPPQTRADGQHAMSMAPVLSLHGPDGSSAADRAAPSLSLSAGERIAPPESAAGGRGLLLSAVAIMTLLVGAGAAYLAFDSGSLPGAAKTAALPSDPVAVAAVRPPLAATASRASSAEPQPLETGALPATVPVPAPVQTPAPAGAAPLVETAPVPVPAAGAPAATEPAAAAEPPVAAAPPVVVAGPPATQVPLAAAAPLKIINAAPRTEAAAAPSSEPASAPPRPVGPQAAPPSAPHSAPPAKATAAKTPPPKSAPPPAQKVARADLSPGPAGGRPLPPVSELPPVGPSALPPARPATRTPPSGLASERLPPPARQASANSRDPVQMRAVAAGLHPQIPRDLLERLTPTDLRNAGIAVQTAVAEAPDGEVFVFPRERYADLATYQVRMLRAVHPECRRYVVTVTKSGWSTTAPPMENCDVMPSRGGPLPPPDGPPPLRY